MKQRLKSIEELVSYAKNCGFRIGTKGNDFIQIVGSYEQVCVMKANVANICYHQSGFYSDAMYIFEL